MKQFITICLMLSISLSIQAQMHTRVNAYLDSLPKTFDIEDYNRRRKKGEVIYYTKDSTYIDQFGTSDKYIESIQPKGSYIQAYSEYFKDGKLKKRGGVFPNDFTTGIWKFYDKEGNLIKEEDEDAPFTFTFMDVLAFMKKRNIPMGGREFYIRRAVVKGRPSWGITFEKADKTGMYYISVHGVTGEIIHEKEEEYMEECGTELTELLQRAREAVRIEQEKKQKEAAAKNKKADE